MRRHLFFFKMNGRNGFNMIHSNAQSMAQQSFNYQVTLDTCLVNLIEFDDSLLLRLRESRVEREEIPEDVPLLAPTVPDPPPHLVVDVPAPKGN